MKNGSTTRELRLNIHPGEWYFGRDYDNLYTVLGSCVALSVWHPTLKIGGLCHYLLPVQPKHLRVEEDEGRYGKTVLPLFKKIMASYAPLQEYQLGLFGGSDTMLGKLPKHGIGKQNIVFAQHWLEDENLVLTYQDLGGTASRSLMLELMSGVVSVKSYSI